MKWHDIITEAITSRRLLALTYAPGARLVEPCAYGCGADQQGLLRSFQRSGASASGEHENWKLFRTDRIIRLEILDERFLGDRPEYHRGDRAMKGGIYCQI